MDLSKVLHLARYYASARILGQKNPILCGLKLTHRCTLKCKQCPYWQRPSQDLTMAQIRQIMLELYQKGIRILILEGGEPLLWKDGEYSVADLVREAKKYFWCVGATTNGTLPLDVDTDILWVSIDGLKDTHDALRGTSFDRIINHINTSQHPKIFANITINRLNVIEIPELVKFLSPRVQGITIQFFYPYPESADLSLYWEQRRWVLDKLIELKKQGYKVIDSVVALKALQENHWHCESWMIANVEPDGTYNHGCYLKNRTPEKKPCELCGFAAHTEISLAYQLHWGAIKAGKDILGIY